MVIVCVNICDILNLVICICIVCDVFDYVIMYFVVWKWKGEIFKNEK